MENSDYTRHKNYYGKIDPSMIKPELYEIFNSFVDRIEDWYDIEHILVINEISLLMEKNLAPDELLLVIDERKKIAKKRYQEVISSGLQIDAKYPIEMVHSVWTYMLTKATWEIPLPTGCNISDQNIKPIEYIKTAITPVLNSFLMLKTCNDILDKAENHLLDTTSPDFSPISNCPGHNYILINTGRIDFEIRKVILLSRQNNLELKQLLQDWFNVFKDKSWLIQKTKEYILKSKKTEKYTYNITSNELVTLSALIKEHILEVNSEYNIESIEIREDKIVKLLEPLRKRFSSHDHIDKIAAALANFTKDKTYPTKGERLIFNGLVKEFYPYFNQLVDNKLTSRRDISIVLPFFICNNRDGLEIGPSTVYQNLKDYKSI